MVTSSDKRPFYSHIYNARVDFHESFITSRILPWVTGEMKGTVNRFYTQINDDKNLNTPTHMCIVESDYKSKIGELYICSLTIVTGLTDESDILSSIIASRHAYLHMPGRLVYGECFLDFVTPQILTAL
jgi:hypothetical protein